MIGHDIVRSLNQYAVDFLCETSGRYRQQPIFISNCPHTPPPYVEVQELMEDCLKHVAENWDKQEATYLAAYVLWRMCWIHPFVEGNGRTARAVCYLVLCLKYKMWLPGTKTVLKQMREDRVSKPQSAYILALRDADGHHHRDGKINVSTLAAYLDALLIIQLQS